MDVLQELTPYRDQRGNRIEFEGTLPSAAKVKITFRGSGNRLVVAASARVVDLAIDFSGDDSVVVIGETSEKRTGLRFSMRLGHQCTVDIGANVGAETRTFIRVSEGQSVRIGDDCMLASGVAIRADDSHAIYDVRTGKRTNPAGSVDVGEHVWLGKEVVVMGGVTIGDGTVVGLRSTVTRDLPNNCVAVGAPAKVVRRDVAWERPVLTFREPGIDGVPEAQQRSEKYWNLTDD
ncbi:acyltransferase [Brachybacterium aquaticum]|uniref:Acetyltransferase-like isoleucine patch superfamily enzyme n=1 Tax=Brachybacterium aquaticum TaxID=1432564 RepID=A0A841AAI0_9MICO|nr:acyltransferase [Brachybacterium aquaticum]MBB5830375.1 acetyltransferase-like isoleucine patch superfamily enzyme [Brachybacterium aquaticum]